MYATKNEKPSHWKEITEFPAQVGGKIPTFEKSVDHYFEQNFDSIIAEWELVTDYDLRNMEIRLELVSEEIDRLQRTKSKLQERASNLDVEIKKLEGSQ
jgi:predicted nuclease with TOPRIM domain